MSAYHVRSVQTEPGQWRWAVIDPEGLEVQGGGGYDSVEEAEEAAFDALSEFVEDREPSAADMLVAMVRGRDASVFSGRQVQRTVKIWPAVSFRIEALVQNTGRPRNDLINRLLDVGLETLCEGLSEEERDKLFSVRGSTGQLTKDVLDHAIEADS